MSEKPRGLSNSKNYLGINLKDQDSRDKVQEIIGSINDKLTRGGYKFSSTGCLIDSKGRILNSSQYFFDDKNNLIFVTGNGELFFHDLENIENLYRISWRMFHEMPEEIQRKISKFGDILLVNSDEDIYEENLPICSYTKYHGNQTLVFGENGCLQEVREET